jgi:UDP-N-acetylmuramate dehydrogenase
MNILKNEPLAKYTSFDVGGPAEQLVILDSARDILNVKGPIDWVLGYGTNSVISDEGLPGVVVMLRDGPEPTIKGNTLIADASTQWDVVVQYAIKNGLWGIELTSGIPGNVGAALSGNIGAYGQTIADTFAWAVVFDKDTKETKKLNKGDVELSYRYSSLQDQKNLIILEVALELSDSNTKELDYASAISVAKEMNLTPNTLENRRTIILETRKRAGSMYDELDPHREKTAGSFFKASVVDEAVSRRLAEFDESGKSVDELLEQNKLQGGNSFRASAALVLLAAGFSRGQAWGPVRLHRKHVLKIENTGGASAQNIYDVAQEVFLTVKDKLGITLEPEAQFIGKF